MIQLLSILFFVHLVLSETGEKARYDNYRVYQLHPKTTDQLSAIRDLETIDHSYDIWRRAEVVNHPVDVMVPPHKRAQFHEFLEFNKIDSKINIRNVQELVEKEEQEMTAGKKRGDGFIEWTSYHKLNEFENWMTSLENDYPSIIKVIVVGKTYENRLIKGIEINFRERGTGVYIEAGMHAREWIAPAATSWIVNEIINSPTDSIWRLFNYLYIPIGNPDGYEYTHNGDRLWRKTRKPYKKNGTVCYGADPNRNWDIHWGEQGVSQDPCEETFAGPNAFSENETSSLSEYLLQVGKKYDIALSFHSYSQLILFPWGYTNERAPHYSLWKRIGDAAAADLMAVHGTNFTVGSIIEAIYPSSGSTLEWFYSHFNNTIDFIFECRDTGEHAFVLPAEQIIPAAEELQAAVKRILIEYRAVRRSKSYKSRRSNKRNSARRVGSSRRSKKILTEPPVSPTTVTVTQTQNEIFNTKKTD